MGIVEEYNYNESSRIQKIKETDKEFKEICKKISLFGCCIIILLLLIYVSLIIIILSLNN